MSIKEIPPLIHLVSLPPYSLAESQSLVEKLAATHPDYQIIVHTKPPENFIFADLPVYGPAQLSTLVRLDALRRQGGWYFDLDVHVMCSLKKLEKMLNLGNNLAISHMGHGVCTFVSCCPANWSKWDDIVGHMLVNPRSAAGWYCSGAMGMLLRQKPTLCDYLPAEYIYSKNWLSHKGIRH